MFKRTLVLFTALILATAPLTAQRTSKTPFAERFGIERPIERPIPDMGIIRELNESKNYEEILEAREDVDKCLKALAVLANNPDPKEQKRNQTKIKNLLDKFERHMKILCREIKKVREDWQKEYDKLIKQQDNWEAKVAAARKIQDKDNMLKYNRLIAKHAEQIRKLKNNIDTINSLLFFDEEQMLGKLLKLDQNVSKADKMRPKVIINNKQKQKPLKK